MAAKKSKNRKIGNKVGAGSSRNLTANKNQRLVSKTKGTVGGANGAKCSVCGQKMGSKAELAMHLVEHGSNIVSGVSQVIKKERIRTD